MKRFSLALVSLIGLVSSAFAQTSYNRFGPANGVLVGDPATYFTSAADSSDIRALWSGTCDITTFLRGDGACAAVSITGQALTKTDDTNVTLTLGGSPTTALVNPASLTLGWTGQLSAARGGTGVSSLGTLSRVDDTNVTLTLGGTPTGALINSTSITAGWSGTLAVPRGGIGVGTLTGIAKGNGTSAFTAAASSDVIGTWTGTCNSTTFLRADGTCQVVGSGSGSVTSISQGTGISNTPNPITTTGTIAIDQTFAPTWSGLHTWSGAAAQRMVMNSSDAGGPYFTVQRSGVATGDFGNGRNACGSGFTIDGLGLCARSGNPLQLSANGSTSPHLQINTSGAVLTSGDFTSGNRVFVANGSVGSPSLSFSGENNTGFYRDGTTGRINFTNNGTANGFIGENDVYYGQRQFSAGGTQNSSTAVQLCHSSSGYGQIGVNMVCQAGGTESYGTNDVAGRMAFSNGTSRQWRWDSAAASTGTITWTNQATLSSAGDFAAVGQLAGASLAISGATATVNGQNVCLANGTNCPASSGPTTVFKASAEDRSSTTTLATDADLQFTAAASAIYKVEFCLTLGGVTTGTQGFKFAFNRTTGGSNAGMWGGFSRVNNASATHSGLAAGLGTGDTTGQVLFADITVGNQQDTICGSGSISTTNAVVYAIQWAQEASSANATRLGQGSFLQYQRIN